jgi:hypothetical protein
MRWQAAIGCCWRTTQPPSPHFSPCPTGQGLAALNTTFLTPFSVRDGVKQQVAIALLKLKRQVAGGASRKALWVIEARGWEERSVCEASAYTARTIWCIPAPTRNGTRRPMGQNLLPSVGLSRNPLPTKPAGDASVGCTTTVSSGDAPRLRSVLKKVLIVPVAQARASKIGRSRASALHVLHWSARQQLTAMRYLAMAALRPDRQG